MKIVFKTDLYFDYGGRIIPKWKRITYIRGSVIVDTIATNRKMFIYYISDIPR